MVIRPGTAATRGAACGIGAGGGMDVGGGENRCHPGDEESGFCAGSAAGGGGGGGFSAGFADAGGYCPRIRGGVLRRVLCERHGSRE